MHMAHPDQPHTAVPEGHPVTSTEATAALSQYYDAVPYESVPFPQSAPEHLQAVAGLFGLDAPPVETARVLELGCASGGNLLPFAARHPQATVLGIDLSRVQVEQAGAKIKIMGLGNAEIRQADLSTLDAGLGTFDYIICHGVYSWVPAHVQDAILRIASENLADTGLAYVSYNTYPGWKSREIIRDAMLLRAGGRDPAEKMPYARGMLDFLDNTARPNSILKTVLEELGPVIRTQSDYYLLHDFLEPYNAPCYFRDFVASAAEKGLDYVGESEHFLMFLANYDEAIREPLLREWGSSQLAVEQYLDFVANRSFRQTILAKTAHAAGIRRQVPADFIRRLHLTGVFQARGEVDTADDRPQAYGLLRQGTATLSRPEFKTAAGILNAIYPASLSFEALAEKVAGLLKLEVDDAQRRLLPFVENFVIKGFLGYALAENKAAPSVPPKAVVPAEVRATMPTPAGNATAAVSNLIHRHASLGILEARVALLLDGSRDEAAVIKGIVADARQGILTFLKDGQPIADEAVIEEAARLQVPAAIASLRGKGLIAREMA
jgi:methyltransferase-like protein